MKAVIQRVDNASVTVDGNEISKIEKGLLLLLGIEEADGESDAEWLSQKICRIRLFADSDQKMNLNIMEVSGEILVVSQFTLHASIKKGNRPSFIKSAAPDKARELYQYFISRLQPYLSMPVKTGSFGAMMKVSIVNNGPVTIIIDSKNKT